MNIPYVVISHDGVAIDRNGETIGVPSDFHVTDITTGKPPADESGSRYAIKEADVENGFITVYDLDKAFGDPNPTQTIHGQFKITATERLWQRVNEIHTEKDVSAPKREKICYVGAPAIFALEVACREINKAFGDFGCYLVGSSLERPDWRDVDVRYIMKDERFLAEFPRVGGVDSGRWEFDPKWLLLTISISERLSKITGLPIDFQFQPQSHANAKHKGMRHPLGLMFVDEEDD